MGICIITKETLYIVITCHYHFKASFRRHISLMQLVTEYFLNHLIWISVCGLHSFINKNLPIHCCFGPFTMCACFHNRYKWITTIAICKLCGIHNCRFNEYKKYLFFIFKGGGGGGCHYFGRNYFGYIADQTSGCVRLTREGTIFHYC